jgi:hypothetical protein
VTIAKRVCDLAAPREVLVTETEVDEQQLLAWSKQRIAGYKRPRSIDFDR